MSKRNPIALGRRALAVVRDVLWRWCLGVGSGPSRHRERRGFNAYFVDKKRLIGIAFDKISNPAGVFRKFLPELRDSSGTVRE